MVRYLLQACCTVNSTACYLQYGTAYCTVNTYCLLYRIEINTNQCRIADRHGVNSCVAVCPATFSVCASDVGRASPLRGACGVARHCWWLYVILTVALIHTFITHTHPLHTPHYIPQYTIQVCFIYIHMHPRAPPHLSSPCCTPSRWYVVTASSCWPGV